MAFLLVALVSVSVFSWAASAKEVTVSGSSTVMPLADAAAENEKQRYGDDFREFKVGIDGI